MHLAEPALAVAALRTSPQQLMADMPTVGFLFESLVYHELVVLAERLDADAYHYRDSNGHEIDLVLVLPDSRWAAIEVKVGGLQVADGAASLNKAIAQLDLGELGEPAFRAVITGTGSTFPLDDGTITFPISTIGP